MNLISGLCLLVATFSIHAQASDAPSSHPGACNTQEISQGCRNESRTFKHCYPKIGECNYYTLQVCSCEVDTGAAEIEELIGSDPLEMEPSSMCCILESGRRACGRACK